MKHSTDFSLIINVILCRGTQFSPLIIRGNFVLGYTVFSLDIRDVAAVFHITQVQFISLNNKGKISAGTTQFFPLIYRMIQTV